MKNCETSICKPKGRFFRSVRLYLTDIMIDICRKWRIYLAKKMEKGAFAFGGIGRIGLIRPIGHQLVDPLTSLREGAQKKGRALVRVPDLNGHILLICVISN